MWKFWKNKTEADKRRERYSTMTIEKAKYNLEKDTQTMLTKYCPIQKGICESECIHFVHGKVWYEFKITQLRPYVFLHTSPRCRLWNNGK